MMKLMGHEVPGMFETNNCDLGLSYGLSQEQ